MRLRDTPTPDSQGLPDFLNRICSTIIQSDHPADRVTKKPPAIPDVALPSEGCYQTTHPAERHWRLNVFSVHRNDHVIRQPIPPKGIGDSCRRRVKRQQLEIRQPIPPKGIGDRHTVRVLVLTSRDQTTHPAERHWRHRRHGVETGNQVRSDNPSRRKALETL
jgi:hypothetical protein